MTLTLSNISKGYKASFDETVTIRAYNSEYTIRVVCPDNSWDLNSIVLRVVGHGFKIDTPINRLDEDGYVFGGQFPIMEQEGVCYVGVYARDEDKNITVTSGAASLRVVASARTYDSEGALSDFYYPITEVESWLEKIEKKAKGDKGDKGDPCLAYFTLDTFVGFAKVPTPIPNGSEILDSVKNKNVITRVICDNCVYEAVPESYSEYAPGEMSVFPSTSPTSSYFYTTRDCVFVYKYAFDEPTTIDPFSFGPYMLLWEYCKSPEFAGIELAGFGSGYFLTNSNTIMTPEMHESFQGPDSTSLPSFCLRSDLSSVYSTFVKYNSIDTYISKNTSSPYIAGSVTSGSAGLLQAGVIAAEIPYGLFYCGQSNSPFVHNHYQNYKDTKLGYISASKAGYYFGQKNLAEAGALIQKFILCGYDPVFVLPTVTAKKEECSPNIFRVVDIGLYMDGGKGTYGTYGTYITSITIASSPGIGGNAKAIKFECGSVNSDKTWIYSKVTYSITSIEG